MGMYLNDEAKRGVKQILMLWDEKRQKNAELPEDQRLPKDEITPPSFMEFDRDSRTPKANSLAHSCGSYSEALRYAKYYDKKRDELDPPSKLAKSDGKTPPKHSKNSKPIKTQTKPTPPKPETAPQKAPERPQTPKAEPVSVSETKAQPAAPQAVKPVSKPLQPGELFKLPHKTRKKPDDRVKLTQNLGDLIPEEFLQDDIPPAPAPETTSPEPPAPEELTSMQNANEPSAPAMPTDETARTPETVPLDFSQARLVNYYPGKIAFVSETFYQDYQEGKFRLGTNYQTFPREDNSYAKASELIIDAGQYEVDTNEGHLYVPLTWSYLTPRLVKDDLVYTFPEPEPGRILLVDKKVAEAARDDGRETDDLVFPKKYIRTSNGIVLCAELGKL